MRKTKKTTKYKHDQVPEQYRKIDASVNGDAEILVKKHKEIEKHLYPLRIDKRTVIYVTKDKLTPEYAERKRRNLRLGVVKTRAKTDIHVD